MIYKYIIFSIVLIYSLSLAEVKKFARFENKKGKRQYGLVNGEIIQPLKGDFEQLISGSYKKSGRPVSISTIKLLPPVVPSKMINFGGTFKEPGELGNVIPLIFFKPPSAIIGQGDAIVYPMHIADNVVFEAELALIIGKKGYKLSPEEAMDFVFAYTCHNDLTARNFGSDPSRLRAKSMDTFAPLGPWMVTGIDPENLNIKLIQNGEIKQDAMISEMTYRISYLISMVSQVMTLYPGDVIALGTPPGAGPIKVGDKLEVRIDKIGTLINHVSE